ncbi:unnamed protein product [Orchesella dallaii]|uniref:Uncharacterized protein n=1 Tax=Orchesella dallaii TaxID=48710 RepID=A0ABP1PVT9_9HEXA
MPLTQEGLEGGVTWNFTGLEGFSPLFVPFEDERMTGDLGGLLKLRGEIAFLAGQARRSMGKNFRDQICSSKCNGFTNPIGFTAYQLMEANELKTRHLTKQLEKAMAEMDLQTKSHQNEIAGKLQQLKRLFNNFPVRLLVLE